MENVKVYVGDISFIHSSYSKVLADFHEILEILTGNNLAVYWSKAHFVVNE